jgi:hypothetical protein
MYVIIYFGWGRDGMGLEMGQGWAKAGLGLGCARARISRISSQGWARMGKAAGLGWLGLGLG